MLKKSIRTFYNRERYKGIISSIIDAQYLELFFLLSGKLQNHRGMTQYFFSLKTSSFYMYL